MKNYYDILEITKDASATEIKRAYFKQVKQTTPEKNPEGFKNLRTAYETLKDDIKRRAYDQKQDEDVPEYLVEELQLVNGMLENLHTKEAIATLEYLHKKYPSEPKVVTLLGETYLYAGSTGKAVKYLEQVAGKFVKNQDVQFVLAEAYGERGYHNKAYHQFRKAIGLDKTNGGAWISFIKFCSHEYRDNYWLSIFNEAFAIDEEMFIDNGFELYADFVFAYYKQNLHFLDDDIDFKKHPKILKCLNYYTKAVEQYGRIPDDQLSKVLAMALSINEIGGVSKLTELLPYMEEAAVDNDDEYYVSKVEYIKEGLTIGEFLRDESIPTELRGLIAYEMTLLATCDCPGCKDERVDNEIAILLAKTEIISDIDDYRDGILYLKEKYPQLYEKEAAFLSAVLNPTKARILENKLMSESRRLLKKHPQRIKEIMQEADEDFDFEEVEYNPGTTYVRETPKTGRNAPCPCGSGKKYKRCCG